jgi:hypothetical protein
MIKIKEMIENYYFFIELYWQIGNPNKKNKNKKFRIPDCRPKILKIKQNQTKNPEIQTSFFRQRFVKKNKKSFCLDFLDILLL